MALTNIGTIFYKSGDREKAIDYYRQALDRLPNTVRSHYNLAVAYANTGRFEAAGTHLRWLLERHPNHDASLDLMGLILLKQHRYEEALRFSRRLLRLRPNHRSPNLQIGVALTHMGSPDRGYWFLQRAFRADPGNLVVMLCLLENRLAAGEMAQANIIRDYLFDHHSIDSLQSVLVDGVNEIGDPDTLLAYFEMDK